MLLASHSRDPCEIILPDGCDLSGGVLDAISSLLRPCLVVSRSL
jgi:hypothetical protein